MKLEFIGVGEAFDPEIGNTSILVHNESKILIDCGYAVPRNLFAKNFPANFIDAIYITHFHADHVFGLPALFVRLLEDGRTKPLTIIGQDGTQERVETIFDLAYKTLRKKLGYKLEYIETTDPIIFNELSLSFADTAHGLINYAIRIEAADKIVGVSGDGELTTSSRKLFSDCHVVVHDAFNYDASIHGHANARDLVTFADGLEKLRKLAFVHLQRNERTNKLQQFKDLGHGKKYQVIVPEAYDILEV